MSTVPALRSLPGPPALLLAAAAAALLVLVWWAPAGLRGGERP